ncbi:MAG: hypothetical protein IJ764_04070 [Bacteroidales bacterium]|nr:hypothetical protein [Bacteroidales bacterium]
MDIKRYYYSLVLHLLPSASKRTEYVRRKQLFGQLGERCHLQSRKLPLYANLIHLHNNVKLASNVGFVTHDIIHKMLNDIDLQNRGGI